MSQTFHNSILNLRFFYNVSKNFYKNLDERLKFYTISSYKLLQNLLQRLGIHFALVSTSLAPIGWDHDDA